MNNSHNNYDINYNISVIKNQLSYVDIDDDGDWVLDFFVFLCLFVLFGFALFNKTYSTVM